MSKKKKHKKKWSYVPDVIIKELPCTNNEADFELTFVVKEDYKEIFKRISQAMKQCSCCSLSDKIKLMTDMAININFDTMKINKYCLFGFGLMTYDEKQVKKSLKGKKTGQENIFETVYSKAFYFLQRGEENGYLDEGDKIRSFYSLVGSYNLVSVKNIHEAADKVYCVLSMIDEINISGFEIAGKFIGTFGDTSEEIDICYRKSEEHIFENDAVALLPKKIENDIITIDLTEVENCKNKQQTMQLIDVSDIWEVNARIEVNAELHEAVKALNEFTEIMESEGYINQRERVELETDLLITETDITRRYLDERVAGRHLLGRLREYQAERVIKRFNNPVLKSVFENNKDVINVFTIEDMLAKLTSVSTVGFDINEQNETVEWVMKAQVSGFNNEELRKCFNMLIKNSNVSEIEFTLKENNKDSLD